MRTSIRSRCFRCGLSPALRRHPRRRPHRLRSRSLHRLLQRPLLRRRRRLPRPRRRPPTSRQRLRFLSSGRRRTSRSWLLPPSPPRQESRSDCPVSREGGRPRARFQHRTRSPRQPRMPRAVSWSRPPPRPRRHPVRSPSPARLARPLPCTRRSGRASRSAPRSPRACSRSMRQPSYPGPRDDLGRRERPRRPFSSLGCRGGCARTHSSVSRCSCSSPSGSQSPPSYAGTAPEWRNGRCL